MDSLDSVEFAYEYIWSHSDCAIETVYQCKLHARQFAVKFGALYRISQGNATFNRDAASEGNAVSKQIYHQNGTKHSNKTKCMKCETSLDQPHSKPQIHYYKTFANRSVRCSILSRNQPQKFA